MDQYVIFVVSYDGYQDVWPNFFRIFKAYWPDCPFTTYLINNSLRPAYCDVINTGDETSWCDRVQIALETIAQPNILLLLEDYFLGEKVLNEKIYDLIAFYERNNCRYLRLINIPRSRHNKTITPIVPIVSNEEYGINLQPAIWKKEFLQEILRSVGGSRSAWEFEIFLLRNAQLECPVIMQGCYATNYNFLNIHNGILKGKWFPNELKYYEKRGLAIDVGDREKLTLMEYSLHSIRFFVREHITYNNRKRIKKILRKFKCKFVSEI